jgi:hypothetical protein
MRAYNAGARPQRLLWASTGTKDPKASDLLYVKALAAPFTVNTMPEGTLKALADHSVDHALADDAREVFNGGVSPGAILSPFGRRQRVGHGRGQLGHHGQGAASDRLGEG